MKLTIVLALACLCGRATALEPVDPAVCKTAANSKRAGALLIGPDGKLSPGPIDFGEYPVQNDRGIDLVAIPTGYRILLWPKRLEVHWCKSAACTILAPLKSPCANTLLFDVSYGVSVKPGSIRPYRIGPPPGTGEPPELRASKQPIYLDADGISIEDPQSKYGATAIEVKWDQAIIGTLVSPKR